MRRCKYNCCDRNYRGSVIHKLANIRSLSGRLCCYVCRSNFLDQYQSSGDGYIKLLNRPEAHRIQTGSPSGHRRLGRRHRRDAGRGRAAALHPLQTGLRIARVQFRDDSAQYRSLLRSGTGRRQVIRACLACRDLGPMPINHAAVPRTSMVEPQRAQRTLRIPSRTRGVLNRLEGTVRTRIMFFGWD